MPVAAERKRELKQRRSPLPFLLALSAWLLSWPALALPPLQPWIDVTPAGGTLKPPPGSYAGPVIITRAMVLDGDGQVTIDGGGTGTVLTLHGSGATLRGLRIVGSGGSHDKVDSGILVEGDGNTIEGNTVEDVLFGITLHQANDNRLLRNVIRSRPHDVAEDRKSVV